MKKLTVAFLVDDLQPSKYVIDLISFVKKEDNFNDPIIITGYKPKISITFFQKFKKIIRENPKSFFNIFCKILLIKIIRKIEIKSVIQKFPKFAFMTDNKFLESFQIIKVIGSWSKSGLYLEFTDEDLNSIYQKNLDCIIRCGSGILRGNILSITKFGVISIHGGDNRVNRGGPSGFWEVLNGEPSSGFIIQKLNEELDGGKVLCRGNLMTANLWFLNYAQLLEKSNVFLMKLLKNLAINRHLPETEDVSLHCNIQYKIDSPLPLLKYLIKIIIPKILNKLISKLISPLEIKWSVAYANHNNFSKSLWKYKEIKNPENRFLADPFVFENNANNYIFVEDFCYKDQKGRISAIKINDNGYEFLGIVLEEDFHLSFPFIFKDRNEIYMIPESNENKDVRLYKCLDFPYRWVLDSVLLTDISAADTMVIKKNNVWYMLTNICSAGINDHKSELHIFYANELKTNFWQPLATGNPVIFNSLKARNGGIFNHKGKIYRVNQVHKQSHYGKCFNINEVVMLSESGYLEKELCTINPKFKEDIISTHHFSANETIASIDFAKTERRRKVFKTKN